jgi:hypothetical protein
LLISAENPEAGDAELSTTSSGRYLTTTTPPPVWIVREDQAVSEVGGLDVDEEPGEVEGEDEDGDEETVLVDDDVLLVLLLLLDEELGAVDGTESDVLGAGATWMGG